ncbi:MAG TPA: gliding motility-associated C-terminal domain-containing protein, partial [Segetibacter sp.]
NPPQAAFTIAPPEACVGTAFVYSDASSGVSGNIVAWDWKLGDGTTSLTQNTSRKYANAGTFTASLSVTNDKGCSSVVTSNNITVHPYPTVNAGPDLIILEGGSSVINSVVNGNELSFLWSPGTYLNNAKIQIPTSTPSDDITYKLTVTAKGGCSASDDIFIKVLKSPAIPNAFSPNKDGINDTWNIGYLETYPGATIEVFNRYGQVVFTSVGYSTPWNGTKNGSPLPAGVYYYIVNPKNGRKQITGSVTIIR